MTDAINKMRLCIQEMKFCKSIIDCKGEVDEWCAHLFAIYITIRMDDFTKMVGKHIPKTNGNRDYFTEVLTRYNNGYRSVRDKIGAHFQNPKETGVVSDIELQQRLSIYSSLDYDNICNLVDVAVLLFQIVCEDAAVDVAFHLIWHLPEDQYEQCYHALLLEQMGANDNALRYMRWLADQYPMDDGIQKCLEDMKGRIEAVENLT